MHDSIIESEIHSLAGNAKKKWNLHYLTGIAEGNHVRLGETRTSPAGFGQIAPPQAAGGSFSLLIGMKRKLEHYTNDSPIYVFD